MPPKHLRLAATAAFATLVLMGCGDGDNGSGSEGTTGGGPSADLVVHAKDSLEFDRELYTIPADDPISVAYVDDGSLPHTLVVEDHEDDMRLEVTSGGNDSGTITLPPGEYTIYCDIAGHRSAGMQARLVIEG